MEITVENPLIHLPFETLNVLRTINEFLAQEQEEKKEDSRPIEVKGAELVLRALEDVERMPKDIDKQKYLEVVTTIVSIEKDLKRPSPSATAEEVSLLLQGKAEEAQKLALAKAELSRFDSQLTASLFGTTPGRAFEIAADESFPEHNKHRVEDKKRFETNRLQQICEKYGNQARAWMYEKYGKNSQFPDHIKRMLKMLESGVHGEELAPLPKPGNFEYLVDDHPENSEIPVRCYQGQLVKTKRDIESPAFSSCAGVVLYKEGSDETIFAHLPPRTFRWGGPSHFKDYTPEFFLQKLNITNLHGYKAKIFAGLMVPPDDIEESLGTVNKS